jgi:hypothetical protein
MQKPNNTSGYYTTRQLKLPLKIEKIIDIADPVYSFCDVMDHIDLTRYLAIKDRRTGRPRTLIVSHGFEGNYRMLGHHGSDIASHGIACIMFILCFYVFHLC